MANLTLTDAYVSVGGNDLSSDVKSVTLNYSAAIQDNTAMGDTSMARISGLKDWSLDIEFNQDFAAAALDSILFSLVGVASVVAVRPVSGAASTSNPEYGGTGLIEGYAPISGAVGDVATTSINIQCSNGVALTRATS